jgi:hypothetical protein
MTDYEDLRLEVSLSGQQSKVPSSTIDTPPPDDAVPQSRPSVASPPVPTPSGSEPSAINLVDEMLQLVKVSYVTVRQLPLIWLPFFIYLVQTMEKKFTKQVIVAAPKAPVETNNLSTPVNT